MAQSVRSRISVVMANFNYGRYIAEALVALAEQSRPPHEIIVVDDASTDDSISVIESVKARYPYIRLVKNEVNQGALKSVKKAESLAVGELICYQSADDKVLPGFFETFVALLEKYPQAGLATAPLIRYYEETGVETPHYFGKDIPEGYLSPEQVVEYDFRGQFRIGGPALLFRRSAITESTGLHEDLGGWADTFMDVVIAFRHGICYHTEPMAWLRISPTSYGARERANRIRYIKQVSLILRKLMHPEFRDILPLLQKSGFVAGYGMGWLVALALNPPCWPLASSSFFKRLIGLKT